MPSFDLMIATKPFAKVGVAVEFDESRYQELLYNLAPAYPEAKLPLVNLQPSQLWGASRAFKLASEISLSETDRPGGIYNPSNCQIDVRASENIAHTNRSLLLASRVWAADVNGEFEDALRNDIGRRSLRRAKIIGSVATMAGVGYMFGSADGALAGSLTGVVTGLQLALKDKNQNPSLKAWRQYANNPDVIAKYGRIINYRRPYYS